MSRGGAWGPSPTFFVKNDPLKVGVLCGGRSSERAVSLRSGRAAAEGLKRAGFRVRRIDPRNSRQTRTLLCQIDLAFIALHGHGGEDGSIQKRLTALEIPYTGSGERGSHLAFHKVEAKKIFDRLKIPTPEWTVVDRKNWKRLSGFPAPFFVKPVADGSSIGVFLVEDFRQSAVKIIHALSCYRELLVERQIEGREFTVGILGRKALPVIELRPKGSFYNYRCKYTRGMTDYLVPAPIPVSTVGRAGSPGPWASGLEPGGPGDRFEGTALRFGGEYHSGFHRTEPAAQGGKRSGHFLRGSL